MSKRLNISKETKEAIVRFYIAPHTLNETVREFNLSCRQIVKKILSEYNINLHDKQTVNELSSNNAKAAIKEKYGVDNPFCIDKIKKQNAKNHELRISKELSDEIVSFYLMPNSEAKTARNFKLSRSIVHRILIKNNIQFHDRKSTFSLRDAESELTCLKKYGTKNIGTCKFIQEKVIATCKNKYGVEKPLMSEKIRDKAKKTCLDRYGCENPFSANSVKKKIKDTCRTRYGVE